MSISSQGYLSGRFVAFFLLLKNGWGFVYSDFVLLLLYI